MDNKNNILQIGFNQISDIGEADYMNEGIAFCTDVREFPFKDGALRPNMLVIIACVGGEMQVELNTVARTLRQNEALICRPNDIVTNWTLSQDFNGTALCMTQRSILELFSESNMWDRAFHIAENPIIHISDGSLSMLYLYNEILRRKTKNGGSFYQKEIIVSVIKAAMYELMENADGVNIKAYSYGGGLTSQREVLFKRFVETLAGTQIKPRNISWYAERLYVTPKYLSTVCKQVSGSTALEWINEYVQMDIRHWLKNSNKTIKEVADLLDFPNISFFCKYCRTHFGMSPMELRTQLRKQPCKGRKTRKLILPC